MGATAKTNGKVQLDVYREVTAAEAKAFIKEVEAALVEAARLSIPKFEANEVWTAVNKDGVQHVFYVTKPTGVGRYARVWRIVESTYGSQATYAEADPTDFYWAQSPVHKYTNWVRLFSGNERTVD